jgi:hypothetical protein
VWSSWAISPDGRSLALHRSSVTPSAEGGIPAARNEHALLDGGWGWPARRACRQHRREHQCCHPEADRGSHGWLISIDDGRRWGFRALLRLIDGLNGLSRLLEIALVSEGRHVPLNLGCGVYHRGGLRHWDTLLFDRLDDSGSARSPTFWLGDRLRHGQSLLSRPLSLSSACQVQRVEHFPHVLCPFAVLDGCPDTPQWPSRWPPAQRP